LADAWTPPPWDGGVLVETTRVTEFEYFTCTKIVKPLKWAVGAPPRMPL